MMAFSLTQAAKAAKISKSTLSVAIQKGRVSAVHLPDGSYQIEPVELFRVFPQKSALTLSGEGVRRTPEPHPNPAEPIQQNPGSASIASPLPSELVELRTQVAAFTLERELRDRERESLVGQVEDLRKRLDRSEERMLALSAPIAQPTPQTVQERPIQKVAMVEPAKSSKGFLARLLGL